MGYSKLKVLLLFFLAVVVAFILASFFHSQFVLAGLTSLDVEVPFSARASMTFSDMLGLVPGYGPIIFVGLALGFGIIGLLRKKFNWRADRAFGVGGGLSFAAMHLLMYPIFFVTLIAGARGPWGLAFQCLAGVAAGYLFARLLPWAKKSAA